MKYNKDKLYELLPSIYRKRDEELGKPLYGLLSIIAEQVEIVEDDIQSLYDNWFIETCDKWVVSYIADLVGAISLNHLSKFSLIQRAYVANTISYRRRKGTLAMLEQLAYDVTQWYAHAVEFFQRLNVTQNVNQVRIYNTSNVDLRDVEALESLDTPFDLTSTHTVDLRQIRNNKGYYNIQNIGIFLWRLKAYPIINAPAVKHENDKRKLFFNQLGYDMQLFNFPKKEMKTSSPLPKEINIPSPIRIREFYNYPQLYYYENEGRRNSISIVVDGSTKNVRDIVVCDLIDWKHSAPKGKIAVDPVRGRISFSEKDQEPNNVQVSYYYGFSSEVGGGSL